MDDDALSELLERCDADELVAISQTCRRLNRIAKNLFRHITTYKCTIDSEDEVNVAKRTIANVGTYLTELHIDNSCFASHYDYDLFLNRFAQKCPNLQSLKITSNTSPNVIFSIHRKLDLRLLVRLVVDTPPADTHVSRFSLSIWHVG